MLIESVLGNSSDPLWRERLGRGRVDRLLLDQWEAQKSRLRKRTEGGTEVAISLHRGDRLRDGDVVGWDEATQTATVVGIDLGQSGGDNLTLTFSPALVDFFIYVIDVAAGDKIPRKNGPGISQSDILVINKTDLAPYVDASLEVMERDARVMREDKPVVFTNCKTGDGIGELVDLIRRGALFDLERPDDIAAQRA